MEEKSIASSLYTPWCLKNIFGTILLQVGCIPSCTYICKTSGVNSSGGAMHCSTVVCRGSGTLAPSAVQVPDGKQTLEPLSKYSYLPNYPSEPY